MRCFYLQAKFAVFRPFTSGSFRPTAGFITPSAAYGLLLNLAGIDMRHDDGKSVMTLIKKDLPELKIALGALAFPRRHVSLQQLHNYPVGATGKEHAPFTKGSKYNIIPVKREFLSNIRAYICTDGNEELETLIESGIKGETDREYGLPFLGDNNFLIDRFDPVETREAAHWYERVDEDDEEEMREGITRLTTRIDRLDLSKSRSFLFAPSKTAQSDPTEESWVSMP